jgi:cytochrome c peroxidase
MVTGRWRDINRFKGPILRGLAARAPYFHNGSAKTLEEVVQFYDTRFVMRLAPQEKADLAAFLRAL